MPSTEGAVRELKSQRKLEVNNVHLCSCLLSAALKNTMTKSKNGLFYLQIIPHHGGKPSQKYQQKPGGSNSNRGHEGTLVLD